MNWDVQVKRTNELSSAEITALSKLFTLVFHKPYPLDVFLRKFAGTPQGYSLHSLLTLDGEVKGAFSAIPLRYCFHGREVLFAATADLMIDPAHRNSVRRVMILAELLYRRLAAEDVGFVFASLRDEMAEFHGKLSRWRPIGKVHYYISPVRLPWLGPFSGLARYTLRAWNQFQPRVLTAPNLAIEKVTDAAFCAYRYRVFPVDYKTIELTGGTAVYLTAPYYPIEGLPPWVRLGLLLDVHPLTQSNFDAALTAIRRRESQLTAIAYQGRLPFQSRDVLQVPAKYEKQPWTLAGRVLRPDLVDERVYEIDGWNINLSNGDLV